MYQFSIKSCTTLYIHHFIQIKLLGIKTALNILYHYIVLAHFVNLCRHSTLNDMFNNLFFSHTSILLTQLI